MRSLTAIPFILVPLALGAFDSKANFIRNGPFEESDVYMWTFPTTGSTALPGWTGVDRQIQFVDGVDVGPGYQGSDGRKLVNLAGNSGSGMGIIPDPFQTEIGQADKISFDLAGRHAYGNASASATINNAAPLTFPGVYDFTQGIHMNRNTHSFE